MYYNVICFRGKSLKGRRRKTKADKREVEFEVFYLGKVVSAVIGLHWLKNGQNNSCVNGISKLF